MEDKTQESRLSDGYNRVESWSGQVGGHHVCQKTDNVPGVSQVEVLESTSQDGVRDGADGGGGGQGDVQDQHDQAELHSDGRVGGAQTQVDILAFFIVNIVQIIEM